MDKDSKIFIAGHRGLVGSAICRKLTSLGYKNIICRAHEQLELTCQKDVDDFFKSVRPEYVFLAAAKVGGIMANINYPAEFIFENLMISANVIDCSYRYGVKKLINLGSSCIYPKNLNDSIREEDLLKSSLEETNEAYAVAKISAAKLCQYYNRQYGTNFITLMPTNQYGINDNFNLETAHLLPMVLRKFHIAKLMSEDNKESVVKDLKKYDIGWGLDNKIDFANYECVEHILNNLGIYKDKVRLWGDGSVYRELMSSDDLAEACVFIMEEKNADECGHLVNITSGKDILLKDLFILIKDIVGFNGKIEYDNSKPNGTMRKLMDASKIKKLGWQPKISLESGIKNLYEWYKEQ